MNTDYLWRRLTLNELLVALISLGVVMPVLACGLTGFMIEQVNRSQIESIQALTQETDQLINDQVTVQMFSGRQACADREYHKDGVFLAKDSYVKDEKNGQCRLSVRTYHRNGKLVAKDVYGLPNNDEDTEQQAYYEKRREYYTSDGDVFLREDFGRGGVALQKEYLTVGNVYRLRRNSMRSPLPPAEMLFVSFYR